MTLTETYLLRIMQHYGWTVQHWVSTDNPDDDSWQARKDEHTVISHFTLQGLFEKWVQHPVVLAQQFGVKTVGGKDASENEGTTAGSSDSGAPSRTALSPQSVAPQDE